MSNQPMPLGGTCKERFDSLRESFAANLESGDLGASLAVNIDDEMVVHLWGGFADERGELPVQVSAAVEQPALSSRIGASAEVSRRKSDPCKCRNLKSQRMMQA